MSLQFDIDERDEDYPAQTNSQGLGIMMERDHEALLAEQDKREPLINTIEHHGSVFLADVEKVAAQILTDENGSAVMRRVWVDDAEGFPRAEMSTLIRNYGTSSKPSGVFAGNHGMGLILANGMANPAGLVILTKQASEPEPYMSYWWRNPTSGVWALRGLWLDDPDSSDDEPTGATSPVLLLSEVGVLDGIDWQQVWLSAYDNTKFKQVPDSGSVIVEVGRSLTDSTYLRSQRNFDAKNQEWVVSRWATGQYFNSHFWSLPLDVFWGVPQTDFDLDSPDFKLWGYRRATGLQQQISTVTQPPKKQGAKQAVVTDGDDEELPEITSKVTLDHTDLLGPVPARVEVYMRELPPGVIARKLNFQVRRRGMVFVDYNGELFAHPDPLAAHAQFGMVHGSLRENVWVRIIPTSLGEPKPGSVWMPARRGSIKTYTAAGTSVDFPWTDVARTFRGSMPPVLVTLIKKLDSGDENANELEDKKYRKWWEKLLPAMKKRKIIVCEPGQLPLGPRTGPVVEDQPGPKRRVVRGAERGPVVNPGETHSEGSLKDKDEERRPRRRRKMVDVDVLVEKEIDTPDPQLPQPPHITWVMTPEGWGLDDMRYGVRYQEPDSTNDWRGRVYLNWCHWYVQQKYHDIIANVYTHGDATVSKHLRSILGLSAASKIGHRRQECRDRSIGMTADDQAVIWHPASLTGFLLGVWDHEQRLMGALGGAMGGKIVAADEDASAEEAS